MKLIIIMYILFTSATLYAASPLYPISEDNKVGYIDTNGQMVIIPKYDTESTFYQVNTKNKSVKGIYFPENAYFSEGVATVRIGKWFWFFELSYQYACIDTNDNIVTLPSDVEVKSFKNGMAVARFPLKHFQYVYDNQYGYLDANKVLRMRDYKWADSFYEGKALVLKNGLYGFIDTNFNFVIDCRYIDANRFSEGLAPVRKDSMFGFVDETGTYLIEDIYVKAWPFSNGIARVFDGVTYSFINRTGKPSFKKTFKSASDFSDGLSRVKENGKVGFIDTVGNFIISPIYNRASDFENGIAAVEKDGLWGFIDKNGNYILELKYDYANNFRGQLAEVWIDDEMFYININGKIISQVFWKTESFFWWK